MKKEPIKDNEIPIWVGLTNVLNLGRKLNPFRESARISLIYILFGALWILLSDKVLELMVSDKGKMIRYSMFKGWLFVVTTGCIIFMLTYITFSRVKRTDKKLIESYEELAAVNEELTASDEELRTQILQIQEYQDKLHHMAYYDELTGLPGRLSLQEDITKLLTEAQDRRCILVYIDLDNFKLIKDTKGQVFSDEMLKKLSRELQHLQQKYSNLCFYRLGGDEFIASISGLLSDDEEEGLMKVLSETLKTTVNVGNSAVQMTASMGVAVYPEHGNSLDELKRCACIAVLNSKKMGKNKYTKYTKEMDEQFRKRREIEEQLETAMENKEFEIYYQPQVDMNTFKITGLEALIRWKNKKLGFIPPDKFIGIAEETHLIVDIGEWVLKEACLFAKFLHERGYKNLQVSVNVSIVQLLEENFVGRVKQILSTTGVDPKQLELEITESTLIQSFDLVITKLNQLKEEGVKIALDDFGKGYSSLSYLNELPITTLKIDKVFIDNVLLEAKAEKLTELIIDIGKELDLCVIAEGVEEKDQLQYLVKRKCDKIQGYLFSKPLPQDEVKDFLKDNDFKCFK
ncbi:MAG: bifunctional diguanylate cyclase/phosphodiesterase [Bacillota bacterium]|nr:bifunctional diguanylate cyclase/phosphodiesterase [Bacillota bacterium]